MICQHRREACGAGTQHVPRRGGWNDRNGGTMETPAVWANGAVSPLGLSVASRRCVAPCRVLCQFVFVRMSSCQRLGVISVSERFCSRA